ncbi:MAG: MFS transporter, partial [Lachnospiraceae bacterium]
MTTKTVKPFGFKDKLGYMFGDFGNDFTFMLSSIMLMKFYSDVMGVSVGLVGTMMMLARFVDAFTDVAMGQIVDRSKPRAKGKFLPWILRMCGPVAVASFLMYASWFQDMPMGFKIFWMFFTYLLWGSVFYTSINIPYGSMASAISADPKERAQLSNWRT